ncbi:MAG: restriction endonuclease, partial [Nitrospirae bacterium]|nr:restriction endonuclease [Nitrospirota bacterium]
MKIVETYSHLNGEEYLLVHHSDIYKEIKKVISAVDASKCMTKKSREKTMHGKKLYNPRALNSEFRRLFREEGWHESRYSYYVTTNRQFIPELIPLQLKEQKKFLIDRGICFN